MLLDFRRSIFLFVIVVVVVVVAFEKLSMLTQTICDD